MEASTGSPASLVTPVAWLVGLAVVFVLARQRLNAMDLSREMSVERITP